MSKNSFYKHPKALVETRQIGKRTRVWAFSHLMKDVVIGEDCNIGDHAFLESGVRVGDRVTIKNGVSLWDGVCLENDVFIGPNAVFTNDKFPQSRRPGHREKTVVKRGATIGANGTIICGVVIGEYAFVGAGSVVTKDVPPYSLVYGNPSRHKSYVCVCRKPLKGKSKVSCASCGKDYVLKNGHLTLIPHS